MSETLEDTIARIRRKWPEAYGLPKDGVKGPGNTVFVPNRAIVEASEAQGSAPPERPGRSEDVKPPALADRGRLQENLKNLEEVDFKLRASGERDEGQDTWDGQEPPQEEVP